MPSEPSAPKAPSRADWHGRFPPLPPSLRGRARELATLTALIRRDHPTALALVGGGGSGKSTLAAALGHRLRRHFDGRIAWIRIGAWDPRTVLEMIALGLGHAPGEDPARTVRRALGKTQMLIVLDNHESDVATAAVLGKLRGVPVTWILTARRCLLGGVTIFPVVPPLIERREILFPRVAKLTRKLRWNAVALDIADGLVASGRATLDDLQGALVRARVDRITAMAHEDDVPEVRAVVLFALSLLGSMERRLLAVLASSRGDAIGEQALITIARGGARGPSALASLREVRLVQEPAPRSFALHATVRAALERALKLDPVPVVRFYLERFERDPREIAQHPSQLFALMDFAQEAGDVGLIVRVNALATMLSEVGAEPLSAPSGGSELV